MKTIGQVAYEAWPHSHIPWDEVQPWYQKGWHECAEAVRLHLEALTLPPLTPTTTMLADAPKDKVCENCSGKGFFIHGGIELQCRFCQGKGYVQ